MLAAAGLAAWPLPAIAQDATQAPATNAPAPVAVGPRELQNFNLQGTVTRPADQPAATPPQSPAPATESAVQRAPAVSGARAQRPAARRPATPLPSAAAQPLQAPPALARDSAGAAPLPSALNPGLTPAPSPSPASSFAPRQERQPPLWPLLVVAGLGAGAAFLFWRRRSRRAFAGGAEVDDYVAPESEPEPATVPVAAPPPRPAPAPLAGVVSSRLRPWIDVAFQPLNCAVEDDKVTIDFELELFNSGSAPARAVLAEASLFNAGADQDQALGAFFAKPAGRGERIITIEPLKRVALRHQVVVERSQVTEYELAGHKVFVPVIGFNALYRWSGGEGQTSAAYLLGRDTSSDKLGPFRLDVGRRSFGAIAGRPLPLGVRS
jgi:hypothetical protein